MNRRKLILIVTGLSLTTAGLLLFLQSSPTRADETPPASSAATVDTRALPLGDSLLSTEPQRGHLWSCQTRFGGGEGAFRDGPWIKNDGVWDKTAKISVSGSVSWPEAQFSIQVMGDQRQVMGNGLPDHPTGAFPVATSDPAYQYDRNPNRIAQQTIAFTLPLYPTLAAAPSCVAGMAGIMKNGVLLFNAIDAIGRDAVAHEIQDSCDGHPQRTGQYHYHSLSNCLTDAGDAQSHSALLGYAFDGFGIFGYRGASGKLLTNADLDECHGHSHAIEWEGKQVVMYHYHATQEYPYTVGCFRGAPVRWQPNGEGPAGGPPPKRP